MSSTNRVLRIGAVGNMSSDKADMFSEVLDKAGP